MERVEEHLGLVWYVIRKYFKNTSQEEDELFQIGCIGLIKANERFDESYGAKFSTYAVSKIWGEIQRYFRDEVFGRSEKKQEFNKNIVYGEQIKHYKPGGKPITIFSSATEKRDYIKEFENRNYINNILRTLTDKEKQLVKHRYIDGLNQTDTGIRMGVSQVQISRLEKAMRNKIKVKFSLEG